MKMLFWPHNSVFSLLLITDNEMDIASEYGGGFTIQSGRQGVTTTGVTRLTHGAFVCSSVCGKGDRMRFSLRWWRVTKNWHFLFFFPNCRCKPDLGAREFRMCPLQTEKCTLCAQTVCTRWDLGVNVWFYGMCACTGIIVITCVHGKSRKPQISRLPLPSYLTIS